VRAGFYLVLLVVAVVLVAVTLGVGGIVTSLLIQGGSGGGGTALHASQSLDIADKQLISGVTGFTKLAIVLLALRIQFKTLQVVAAVVLR
jgi:hypothetical protein